MRIVYMGCLTFSLKLFQVVQSKFPGYCVGIVTKKRSPFNADFCSLERQARVARIPYFLKDGRSDPELAFWIKERTPDIIYCFGWSHLLSKQILELPPRGVIGYHPTPLPLYRGRHPIIWSLVLGLSKTASTFFFMDEGVDSGDILSQKEVVIAPSDDAGTLYRRLIETAEGQVEEFTQKLKLGTHPRVPQNHTMASYWRKRSERDGEIDWRMSAIQIHNLVRALTPPYGGAYCVFQGQKIKVWKTCVIHESAHAAPGSILRHTSLGFVIQAGKECIEFLEHEFPVRPSVGDTL